MSRMIRWVRFAVVCALLGLALADAALAQDKLVVKVGASADAATEAKETNLSLDALRAAQKAEGKSSFSVTSSSGEKVALELSGKEAGDILGGTTVVANATGAAVKVWISVTKEQAAPPPAGGSGW